MQIVSNSMEGAISPWSAWQMLFNPHEGDEAVIFTGYLSGGVGANLWCEDIINDLVEWLQYPRPEGKLPRRLSIHVGSWNDPGSYSRSVDMLGRILAHISPPYRQHVVVSEVPNLHVKAYAIYAGVPGTGTTNCIRLLSGSSNLTFASMAVGNNIELDLFHSAPIDSSVLRIYGRALRDVTMQCISKQTYNQALPVATLQRDGLPIVAKRVCSDASDRCQFYSDIESTMLAYEHQLMLTKAKSEDDAMQDASDECMRSDTNS